MDIVCNEKCKYCGAPLEDYIYSAAGKKRCVKMCSANCQEKRELRQQKIEKIRQLRIRYKKAQFKIRKRLRHYNGLHKEEAQEFVNSFKLNNSQSLFIIGVNEKEKTELTEAITKELFAKKFTTLTMSLSEYLIKLQQTTFFDKELLFDDQIASWMRYDLLVITNFGLGDYSGKKLENSFLLFSRLIRNRKNFIVTARPEDIARLKESSEIKPVFELLNEQTKVLTFK